MKKTVIFLIKFYQLIIANVLNSLGLKTECRFSPTCSEYTKDSILKKGFIKGFYTSLLRILKCQPFYN
jgi:uncharacterized protein